jgi:hypothetical protein
MTWLEHVHDDLLPGVAYVVWGPRMLLWVCGMFLFVMSLLCGQVMSCSFLGSGGPSPGARVYFGCTATDGSVSCQYMRQTPFHSSVSLWGPAGQGVVICEKAACVQTWALLLAITPYIEIGHCFVCT